MSYDQDHYSAVGKDQTVPYGTDSRLNLFQAINCLATIISVPPGRILSRAYSRQSCCHGMPGYQFIPPGQSPTNPLTELKPQPKPLEGRSLVDTKDLLDIFPGRLPFAIVHVNVGLAAARQVALKGVRFCSEQVVGIDNFGHKGNILALDSP